MWGATYLAWERGSVTVIHLDVDLANDNTIIREKKPGRPSGLFRFAFFLGKVRYFWDMTEQLAIVVEQVHGGKVAREIACRDEEQLSSSLKMARVRSEGAYIVNLVPELNEWSIFLELN